MFLIHAIQFALYYFYFHSLFLVNSTHVPRGCLSNDQKFLYNLKKLSKNQEHKALSSRPKWCLINEGIYKNNKNTLESSAGPYLIHTRNYTQSDAVMVKIRTNAKDHTPENRIKEVVIQARALGNKSKHKVIGHFFPQPKDVDLACCTDFINLNTARIFRPNVATRNFSVRFLWQPSISTEDYEGPFEFAAAIMNSASKNWTFLKSHPQITKIELNNGVLKRNYEDYDD